MRCGLGCAEQAAGAHFSEDAFDLPIERACAVDDEIGDGG
jgi:hypothetical protein